MTIQWEKYGAPGCYDELMQEPERLDALLSRGAGAARAVAEPKVQLMKERVGFAQ